MSAALSFPLSQLDSSVSKPVLSPALTGLSALDRASGIPCAALTEIWGSTSSGRTSLLLSLLRATTHRGEFCVLIETQDTFDPQTAAASGMELSRLLWIRCDKNPEHAVKAADLLVHAGGFCLVVLDLAGTPTRLTNRIPITSWFRLRHGAEQSGSALVVTAEQPLTGSCAQMQLTVKCERVQWSPKLLSGTEVQAECLKRRRGQTATFCAKR